MPSYKLYYFNMRGRAETLRMMFAATDTPYEDIRWEDTEWPTYQAKAPLGKAPWMEVDGVTLCQSHAMERLVAKRLGLYGSTDIEQAKVDMFIDTVEEFGLSMEQSFNKMMELTDEDAKAAEAKKFCDETGPVLLQKIEKQLQDNGFLIKDKLLWSEHYIYTVMDWPDESLKIAWDKYPRMQKLRKNVEKNIKIANYLKNRPKTIY